MFLFGKQDQKKFIPWRDRGGRGGASGAGGRVGAQVGAYSSGGWAPGRVGGQKLVQMGWRVDRYMAWWRGGWASGRAGGWA